MYIQWTVGLISAIGVAASLNFSIPVECYTDCVRVCGLRKWYWILWKLFIMWRLVVIAGGFRLVYTGLSKFLWFSWISIFRPTVLGVCLANTWQSHCEK